MFSSVYAWSYNKLKRSDSIKYRMALKCEIQYPMDLEIRYRRLGCQLSILQSQYFENEIRADELQQQIRKYEEEFAGMQEGIGIFLIRILFGKQSMIICIILCLIVEFLKLMIYLNLTIYLQWKKNSLM